MVTDADFDTGRFLPFVIELIANSHHGDAEHADDDIEVVTAHDVIPLRFRDLAPRANSCQLVMHVQREDQLSRPSSLRVPDCFWHSAHFVVFCAEVAFAAPVAA
jgi:hypothetical protein